MCPYYNRDQKVCKIYKTTQNSYNSEAYCMEMRYDYTECPNYKQCKQSYGGIVPPPHKY